MEQGAVEHGAGSGARSREPWSREPWSRGAWSRGAVEQGAREQEHAHEVCAATFPGLFASWLQVARSEEWESTLLRSTMPSLAYSDAMIKSSLTSCLSCK